jgi:hypothetical protein
MYEIMVFSGNRVEARMEILAAFGNLMYRYLPRCDGIQFVAQLLRFRPDFVRDVEVSDIVDGVDCCIGPAGPSYRDFSAEKGLEGFFEFSLHSPCIVLYLPAAECTAVI